MINKEYKRLMDDLENISTEKKEILLDNLRKEVDKLDRNLAELLNSRSNFSVMIGKVKRSLKMNTYSPNREREINRKVNLLSEEQTTKMALRRIFERILDESRAIQKNIIEENK